MIFIAQNQSLGFIYGFKGSGSSLNNPFFEMTTAYPGLSNWYGLISGTGFSLSFSVCGVLLG
jgi:hypothetical protein